MVARTETVSICIGSHQNREQFVSPPFPSCKRCLFWSILTWMTIITPALTDEDLTLMARRYKWFETSVCRGKTQRMIKVQDVTRKGDFELRKRKEHYSQTRVGKGMFLQIQTLVPLPKMLVPVQDTIIERAMSAQTICILQKASHDWLPLTGKGRLFWTFATKFVYELQGKAKRSNGFFSSLNKNGHDIFHQTSCERNYLGILFSLWQSNRIEDGLLPLWCCWFREG